MKVFFRALLLDVLFCSLILPAAEVRVFAEARQEAGKKRDQQKQEPPEQEQQPGEFTISVEVPVVTVDVVATTQHGEVIPGLKKENFRILEDGVPQTISNFAPSDAPITIVMVVEFSRIYYGWFSSIATDWAYGFLRHLQQKDWVALETFDLKPKIEVDFTQNKEEVKDAIAHLYFPSFSESNVFDALLDTVERLKEVKGKKSVLLLATGVDTFSKHTLDQTIKQLRQTDVTIFCVGVGRQIVDYWDTRGLISGATRLTYYQGENQLRTFAKMTGGRAWFPQFDGELPGIFQEVAESLRNQYSLAYIPANRARDGKFRKIKVELVGPDGSPLVVVDQHQKKLKYVVYAREGYTAPKGAVGD